MFSFPHPRSFQRSCPPSNGSLIPPSNGSFIPWWLIYLYHSLLGVNQWNKNPKGSWMTIDTTEHDVSTWTALGSALEGTLTLPWASTMWTKPQNSPPFLGSLVTRLCSVTKRLVIAFLVISQSVVTSRDTKWPPYSGSKRPENHRNVQTNPLL